MPMRFTLRQVEYFVAAAELGSISGAAERLHISPASISTAISQLEDTFGVQLFVRQHAHGLSLTSVGRQFLARAEALICAAEDFAGIAAERAAALRGTLVVACPAMLAAIVVPRLRRSFERRHPETRIRHLPLEAEAATAALREARADLVLGTGIAPASDLIVEPIAELTPMALLPARHPLAARQSLTLRALAPEPLILHDRPPARDHVLALFHRARLEPRIAERLGDLGMVHALVGNGFGYTISYLRPIPRRAPDGRPLTLLPLGGRPLAMTLVLATPRSALRPALAEAFATHCRRLFARGRIPGLRPAPTPNRDKSVADRLQ